MKSRKLLSLLLAILLFTALLPAARVSAANTTPYQNAVAAIEARNPVRQKQMARYTADFKTRKTGICNICSMVTLLNRRAALDGAGSSFTVKDALTSNGCTSIKIKGAKCSYKGDTGTWYGKTYKNAAGLTYKAVKVSSATVKKLTTAENFYLYLALQLHEHPEGIAIRCSGANHVAVITKFTVSGNKIQLYVNDPVDNYSGKLEGSYIYKKSGKNLYKDLNYLVYLQGGLTVSPMPVTSAELNKGDTVSIRPTVGAWKVESYSTSDESVCKVDAGGQVTAVNPGTAEVWAHIRTSSSKVFNFKVPVTVKKASSPTGPSATPTPRPTEPSVPTAEEYMSKCQRTDTYLTLTANTSSGYIKTLPCSKTTNRNSADVRALKNGESLTATAVYKNTAGNYWYQVKTSEGKSGYIYGGDAVVAGAPADAVSGNAKLATYTPKYGYALRISGTIKSKTLTIKTVTGVLTGSDGAKQTQTVTVNGTSLDIQPSAINKNLKFGTLKTGAGTLRLTVTLTGKGTNGKALSDATFTVQLPTVNFKVVK